MKKQSWIFGLQLKILQQISRSINLTKAVTCMTPVLANANPQYSLMDSDFAQRPGCATPLRKRVSRRAPCAPTCAGPQDGVGAGPVQLWFRPQSWPPRRAQHACIAAWFRRLGGTAPRWSSCMAQVDYSFPSRLLKHGKRPRLRFPQCCPRGGTGDLASLLTPADVDTGAGNRSTAVSPCLPFSCLAATASRPRFWPLCPVTWSALCSHSPLQPLATHIPPPPPPTPRPVASSKFKQSKLDTFSARDRYIM